MMNSLHPLEGMALSFLPATRENRFSSFADLEKKSGKEKEHPNGQWGWVHEL